MKTASGSLPLALDEMDAVWRGIGGRRLAVFLDYDGTLTPIVATPDLAVLTEAMRETLKALSARLPVIIVSGRERTDVEEKVAVPELVYAGDHGFDIRGGGIRRTLGAEYTPALTAARESLERDVEGIDGVLIEVKSASLAIHYRLVEEARVPTIAAAVEAAVRGHGELRVMTGKKIFEIQPRIDWDKGRAILWLMEAMDLDPSANAIMYVGDDVTDEDGFRAIEDHGIGVRVDGGAEDLAESSASFRLRDTGEVRQFLRALADGPPG